MRARPGDVTQMRPGVLYASALPPPSGASSAADTASTAAETVSRTLWSWTDVVPFVAGRLLATPPHGALLERGSSVTNPR